MAKLSAKTQAQVLLVFMNEASQALEKMDLDHLGDAMYVIAHGLSELSGQDDITITDELIKQCDELRERAEAAALEEDNAQG